MVDQIVTCMGTSFPFFSDLVAVPFGQDPKAQGQEAPTLSFQEQL